jgi:hypothetical protein
MSAWFRWIENCRKDLAALPDECPPGTEYFFNHYKRHQPCLVQLPPWPAFNWTFDSLRQKAGTERVQVQVNRVSDADYEMNATHHRGWMAFREFLDQVEYGTENDTYLTAQNRHENLGLINKLADDLRPMPQFLTDQPTLGYLWIGRGTMTPLHHDVTCNIMCQIMGTKHVRMIAPEHHDKLKWHHGVHTSEGWPDEQDYADRGIPIHDFWLQPGMALHLPCGWLHAVKTPSTSITVVYTNMRWPTSPHLTFTPQVTQK